MSDIVERLRVFPVQGQRPPVHAALRNEAAASIESMRELLARANAEWQGCAAELEQANRRIVAMGEMNDALAARLAEAERDAARYQWLRDRAWPFEFKGDTPEDADAAIDAAMHLAARPAAAKKHTPECSYWDGLMAQVCNCGLTERCCLDYPRCDCNSPPEPDDDWLCFRSPAQPKVTP